MTAQAHQKLVSPCTGPTSGLPSGAKVKGPLITCLMPALAMPGKCSKPISSEGVMRSRSGASSSWPKSHGRVDGRPGLAGLLIGAEKHAIAFLAGCRSRLEVEHADHLAPRAGVEFLDGGHRLGQEIHVFHGQKRQFEADHAPHLARPQPAAIDDVLGLHRALFGDHVPGAVGLLGQLRDAVAEHDLGAQRAARLWRRQGGAGRVEMAFDRVPHGADELRLVHQREHGLGFGRRDQFGVHAEISGPWRGLGAKNPCARVKSASITPPVRCSEQDWPEISSSSL